MSFALEFRKQRLAKDPSRTEPRSAKKIARKSGKKAGRNRDIPTIGARQVAAALLIAGIVLSIFNSGALVQYAGGLADRVHGPTVISLSERWHALMEQGRLTSLTDRVRAAVSTARHTSWEDIARQFGLSPSDAIGEAANTPTPNNGTVSSIPGRYGDQPVKPIRRTSADQSG